MKKDPKKIVEITLKAAKKRGLDREQTDSLLRMMGKIHGVRKKDEWKPLNDAPKDRPLLLSDGENVWVSEWVEYASCWQRDTMYYSDPILWCALPDGWTTDNRGER